MHVGWVLSTSRSLPWQPTEVLYCFLSVQLHIKIMICLFLCNFSLYQSRCMHVHTKHLQKANVPNLFIILCSSLFVYVITTTLFFYPFEKSTAIGQSAFLSLSLPNTFSGRKKISPLIEEKCKSRVSVKGYKRHIVTKSFSDIIHCNIFSCYTCSSFLLTSQKQSSPNDIH